jgi:hypothetical protein
MNYNYVSKKNGEPRDKLGRMIFNANSVLADKQSDRNKRRRKRKSVRTDIR